MLVVAASTSFAPDGRAQTTPPRVHVLGASRLDAHGARASGKLAVSGTLVDDTARPIGGENVALSLGTRGEPARLLPLASGNASACSDAGQKPVLDRADRLLLRTDDGGRFCVRLDPPEAGGDRYVAHLVWSGAANLEGTKLDVPVDLALRAVTLRLDPEPRILPLEGPALSIEGVATFEDDGTTTPATDLPLTLTNEAGTVLEAKRTNASGRARFSVAPEILGPPGRGELRVAFAGNADASATTHAAIVERHARVDLAVPQATGGVLPAGNTEDGVAFDVTAVPHGAHGVPSGSVEARVGETIVGAAPLEAGHARLVVTFASPATSEVPLHVRYVSDAPWYEPSGELTIALPVRGPSPLRHLPVILAGIAVVVWLVLGRSTRARAPDRRRKPRPVRAPAGEARVEVVRAAEAPGGWSGYVSDAHDGFAVPGARVAIERAGFQELATLAESTTGADGSFSLPAVAMVEGDRLVAEGPLHAPVRQPLPPSGELAIALVLRKRALLDRLVAWARRRGKPFDQAPEATPGHVRRTAGPELAVVRWADAVERAAFSGGEVDAHMQAEIDRLAPAADVAATVPDAPGAGPPDAPPFERPSPEAAELLARARDRAREGR